MIISENVSGFEGDLSGQKNHITSLMFPANVGCCQRTTARKDPCDFNTEMFVSKVGQHMSNSWSTSSQPEFVRAFGRRINSTKSPGQDFVHRVAHLVAHDCGYPLSRYTCRATRVAADFLDFIAFCRFSTGVAIHPIKIFGVAPPPPLCREVSHRNLGLKKCRATRGCRSYSCGCRATLCS